MSRRRILHTISAILILAGVVVAGYPLYLKIRGRLELHRLEREYQEYQTAITSLETQHQRQEPAPMREPNLPQWSELPPTRLAIPAINLDVQVARVEDMDIFARKLSQPPSYYPQSAFPGAMGNVLIAGHRGGPAGYFQNLNELEPGDAIILHVPGVSYVYEVEKVWIVAPTEVEVIAPLNYPALTLTTCQRVGRDSSARRLIVRAMLREAVLINGTEGEEDEDLFLDSDPRRKGKEAWRCPPR